MMNESTLLHDTDTTADKAEEQQPVVPADLDIGKVAVRVEKLVESSF